MDDMVGIRKAGPDWRSAYTTGSDRAGGSGRRAGCSLVNGWNGLLPRDNSGFPREGHVTLAG